VALYSQGKAKERAYREQKTPFDTTAVYRLCIPLELKADKALLSLQFEYI